MNEQIDFIGGGANLSPKPSKPIANQRPTIAEEKAELCLRIGVLCRKPLLVSHTAPFRQLANGLLR